jgi:hypothetical protein
MRCIRLLAIPGRRVATSHNEVLSSMAMWMVLSFDMAVALLN